MMTVLFYTAALIALLATVLALTRANAIHALIYLTVSILAIAVIFFLLGAPFAAALEIVIYVGAIMVLFVFVIMMLNLGEAGVARERHWLPRQIWIVPGIMAVIMLAQLTVVLIDVPGSSSGVLVSARRVGLVLFGPYVIAVELASMLLLSGLVGAYHVGCSFTDPTSREGD